MTQRVNTAPSSPPAAIAVSFPPEWEYVELIRGFAADYVARRLGASSAESMRVLVQELLENAVKYSLPATVARFELGLDPQTRTVEASTVNSAVVSRVQLLRRLVAEQEAHSPEEALARALARVPTLPEGKAMLGLVRLRS